MTYVLNKWNTYVLTTDNVEVKEFMHSVFDEIDDLLLVGQSLTYSSKKKIGETDGVEAHAFGGAPQIVFGGVDGKNVEEASSSITCTDNDTI